MDRKIPEQSVNLFLKSTLDSLGLISSNPNPYEMIQKCPKAISSSKQKILSLVDDEIRKIQSLYVDFHNKIPNVGNLMC